MQHILLISLLLLFIPAISAAAEEKLQGAETEKTRYRAIVIIYRLRESDGEMSFRYLYRTGISSAGSFRHECRQRVKEDVNHRGIRPYFKTRFLMDEDSGIILDENEAGDFYFNRFICLPIDEIDDLDLVGAKYRRTKKESREKEKEQRRNKLYAEGLSEYTYEEYTRIFSKDYLVLPDDDPRHRIRYDADRFFARFEKYGVSRTLSIPDDIKLIYDNNPKREWPVVTHWDNEKWGTKISIFPLDQPTEEERHNWWYAQKSPEHIYRIMEIEYHANKNSDELTVRRLEAVSPYGHSRPQTRAECKKSARLGLDTVRKDRGSSRWYGGHGTLMDQDAAMIGGEDRQNRESSTFVRFVCLPMQQIDDLDLSRNTLSEALLQDENSSKVNTHELVLSDADPRYRRLYDPNRFFARFAKHGISQTLATPKREDVEAWLNSHPFYEWKNPWGGIFIFPLDQSNE